MAGIAEGGCEGNDSAKGTGGAGGVSWLKRDVTGDAGQGPGPGPDGCRVPRW